MSLKEMIMVYYLLILIHKNKFMIQFNFIITKILLIIVKEK